MIIATKKETFRILNEYNLIAKKGYGQNFLINYETIKKIAEGAICIGGYSKILCQAAEKPSGWADKWNKYNRPVEWRVGKP